MIRWECELVVTTVVTLQGARRPNSIGRARVGRFRLRIANPPSPSPAQAIVKFCHHLPRAPGSRPGYAPAAPARRSQRGSSRDRGQAAGQAEQANRRKYSQVRLCELEQRYFGSLCSGSNPDGVASCQARTPNMPPANGPVLLRSDRISVEGRWEPYSHVHKSLDGPTAGSTPTEPECGEYDAPTRHDVPFSRFL